MRGTKPNHWSLDRPQDLAFLGLGTAIGMGNFLVLPSAVVYFGGLQVLLIHLLGLCLLGLPLVVAEFVWGRWLVRPYFQSYRSVTPRLGWVPLLTTLAVLFIGPIYFVDLGRLASLLLQVLLHGGYPGATLRPAIENSPLRSYLGAALLISLCSIILWKSSARMVSFMKGLLFIALPAWFILCIWTLVNWGGTGLERILYWPREPVSLEVFIRVSAFSLFSLSAGLGILFNYVFYASQLPLKNDESYWNRPGALLRTAAWILAGDLVASLAAVILVSPYGLASIDSTSAVSSERLVLEWLPQIMLPARGGALLVCLHFAALVAAGLSAALSLLDWTVFALERELKWPRRKAIGHAWVLALAASALPLIPYLHRMMNNIGTNWLLPLSAFFLSYAVGWRMPERAQRQIFGRGLMLDRMFLIWRFSIRYLTPAFLTYILVRQI